MRKTLEDFYYGNVVPCERQMAHGSELKRAADRVVSYEGQLTEQLIIIASKLKSKPIFIRPAIEAVSRWRALNASVKKCEQAIKTPLFSALFLPVRFLGLLFFGEPTLPTPPLTTRYQHSCCQSYCCNKQHKISPWTDKVVSSL